MADQIQPQQNSSPALTPEQLQGLLASFSGGQSQSSQPTQQGTQGLPDDHPFMQGVQSAQQGQPGKPQVPNIVETRPKIYPSMSGIKRLLGLPDYGEAVSTTNQAPISNQLSQMFGVNAPTTPNTDASGKPFLSNADIAPQAALGQTIAQSRLAMLQQMFNMVDPTSATHILGADKATPLIQASVARGFGGFIPKETLGAQQTAGQQDIEKNKTVAGEIGKQGDVNARLGSLNNLIDNLEPLVKKNTPVPFLGGAAAKIVDASGGYGTPGMKNSAMVKNFGTPLTAALNYELTKRFNESEAAFLAQAVTPGPQDNPAYGMQKLNIARKLVSTMQSGNDDALSQVASQIMGKPVAVQSSASSHELQIGTVKKGFVYMGGPASNPNSWRKAGAQ